VGFLDKIRSVFAGGSAAPAEDRFGYMVYVRCRECGETIRARIDMRNELSLRDDADGLLVHKTLIGSQRCYRPVEVTLCFDGDRRLTKREIQGGEFVEAGAYQQPT